MCWYIPCIIYKALYGKWYPCQEPSAEELAKAKEESDARILLEEKERIAYEETLSPFNYNDHIWSDEEYKISTKKNTRNKSLSRSLNPSPFKKNKNSSLYSRDDDTDKSRITQETEFGDS